MSAATSMRQTLLKWHRYLGLALAPFLIIIAATGSIIAFYDELEWTVNAKLHVVQPQEPGWTLQSLLAIREQLETQDPRSHVFSLQFPQRPNESVFSRVMGAIDPATGEPFELDYNEVFANPYTGERLGERFIGNFSLQPKDLIQQIYYLHYALVMPMVIGPLLIGTIGLIWALECCFGFYLTLPPSSRANRKPANPGSKGFFSRWKPSWQIKRGAAGNRLIYEMHRAVGLWVWVLLLMFAWSGFAMNAPYYYARAMSTFTDYAHLQEFPPRPPLDKPLVDPPVSWSKAVELGQRYLAEQARLQGFEVGRPAAIDYRRDLGMYFYLAHTSRDLSDGKVPTETDLPATAATVAIDARDGSFLAVQVPRGQRASNTITSWVMALHTTAIGGLPWQMAVSLLGLVVVVITVTGVLIWWRRRKLRSPQTRARDVRDVASVAPKTTSSIAS